MYKIELTEGSLNMNRCDCNVQDSTIRLKRETMTESETGGK